MTFGILLFAVIVTVMFIGARQQTWDDLGKFLGDLTTGGCLSLILIAVFLFMTFIIGGVISMFAGPLIGFPVGAVLTLIFYFLGFRNEAAYSSNHNHTSAFLNE